MEKRDLDDRFSCENSIKIGIFDIVNSLDCSQLFSMRHKLWFESKVTHTSTPDTGFTSIGKTIQIEYNKDRRVSSAKRKQLAT